MAVFTPVTLSDAQTFCQNYRTLAPITDIIPIAEGTDNSNFILVSDHKKYVLTVFEGRVNPADLPAIFHFTAECHDVVPTPKAYENDNGGVLGLLHDKPAAIVEFLDGTSHLTPSAADCDKIGALLAKLHLHRTAPAGLPENPLSLDAWQDMFDENISKIRSFDQDAAQNIQMWLKNMVLKWPKPDSLPRGAIHADLFPDNVFFNAGKISGIIDFYFACRDFYVYDLMLTVNAWCFDQGGRVNDLCLRAFFDAYQKVRPLNAAEKAALPLMGQAAGLRIALTRLRDFDKAGDFTPRDPRQYLNIIKFYEAKDLGKVLS